MTKFFIVYEENYEPSKSEWRANLKNIKEVFLVYENENELSHIILSEDFKEALLTSAEKILKSEIPEDEEEEERFMFIKNSMLCTKQTSFFNYNTDEEITAYGMVDEIDSKNINQARFFN